MCLFVGLLVCLLFIGHTTFVHFAALPPSTPRAAKASQAARASMHSDLARARARMPYNFTTKKSLRALMPFKNKTARAHAAVYVTAEIFKKKAKKKTNMPLPKFSLHFAFSWSWSVYFSNRTESYLIFGRSRPWSARTIIKCLYYSEDWL